MKDAVLLVFANKNDLPNVMDTQEVSERLGLPKLKDRNWFVQSSCAISGEGLLEGLAWLNSQMCVVVVVVAPALLLPARARAHPTVFAASKSEAPAGRWR